jgi:hypothetical protein
LFFPFQTSLRKRKQALEWSDYDGRQVTKGQRIAIQRMSTFTTESLDPDQPAVIMGKRDGCIPVSLEILYVGESGFSSLPKTDILIKATADVRQLLRAYTRQFACTIEGVDTLGVRKAVFDLTGNPAEEILTGVSTKLNTFQKPVSVRVTLWNNMKAAADPVT